MKTILIIIGIIIYIAIGVVFAAVKESESYEKNGKLGLNIIHIFLWPIWVIKFEIEKLINCTKFK